MKVKVCCIMSEEEARLAVEAGADAIGLVSEMPSGPGTIDDEKIASIVATVPPNVETFLLTCKVSGPEIVAQLRHTHASVVQLVDRTPWREIDLVRRALPDVIVVQVIHVLGASSINDAHEAAQFADRLLLDSGNPHLGVKELGGTGRRHDWSISRKIVDSVTCPVYLAGGLKPSNARDAVEAVNPFGLDLCSGLRTGGALDPEKLTALFRAVRNP